MVYVGVGVAGAYAQTKGIGATFASQVGVSATVLDIAVAVAGIVVGWHMDSKLGDGLIAASIGYGLAAVL